MDGFLRGRKRVPPLCAAIALLLTIDASSTMVAQAPTELDQHGHRVAATLPHMYRYAFQVQNGLAALAAEREKHGVSGTPIRESLRSPLSLSEGDFELFVDSATQFGSDEGKINKRIQAAVNADWEKHHRTRALSDDAKAAVHGMVAEEEDALNKWVANLRQSLPAAESNALDDAVVQFYSRGQHNTILTPKGPNGNRTYADSGKSAPSPSGTKTAGATPVGEATPAVGEGPGCMPACTLPEASSQEIFSSDGTTVIGILQGSISQDDSDNGCWPDIFLDIIQDSSTIIAEGAADSWFLTAMVTVSGPVNVGSKYSLGGYVESCNQDNPCATALLSTTAFKTGPPSITGVSVSSGSAGTSGTIQLTGYDLGGPPGNVPTVNVDGAGLTINPSAPPTYSGSSQDLSYGTQVLNYSLTSDAVVGADTYTLSTVWGTSSATTFTVSCGAPSGLSVQPATWNAGQQISITISGTGLCPGSTISIAAGGKGVTWSSVVFNSSSGTLSASVKPDPADPNETATITVTNPGGSQAIVNAQIQAATSGIYLIDPYLYLSTTSTSSPIDATSLATYIAASAANYDNVKALGMITDGTSTGIAFFMSSVSEPVTLSSTGGVTFAAWNSSFLTTAPSADTLCGTSSGQGCQVTPTIQVGGAYYSIVLIKAPLQSSATLYGSTAATITGSDSEGNTLFSPGLANLDIAPTPVVMVHGLWGGQGSLSSTATYLQGASPWANSTFADYGVQSVCYSKVIAFNATSDTNQPGIAGTGPLCEQTASQALDEAIGNKGNVEIQLDYQHYVGGRVDVVGHSMGGLVARYYSTLTAGSSQYTSIRSRGRGRFRNIVTLDTPEQGSALATFLDFTLAPKTRVASLASETGLIWAVFCGSTSSSITAQQCLLYRNQPLAAPGSSVLTGAVYSLIPPGTIPSCFPNAISTLPDANIPNSSWFPIASNFPDSDSPPAELRSLLNNVISATAPSNPPNLSSILGTQVNDVIVTVASQTTALSPGPTGHTVQFKDLAHAPIPGLAGSSIAQYFSGTSNNNVTQSTAVNTCVASELASSTTAGCSGAASVQVVQAASTPGIPGESPAERSERMKQPLSFAPNRISVVATPSKVPVAAPLNITVTLAPGKLVGKIYVDQRDSFGGEVEEESGPANIVSEAGMTKTIEVIPAQLGQITLELSVLYSDNALAKQAITLNVVPTAKGLKRFSLGWPAKFPLVIEDNDKDSKKWLRPQLTYEGLKYPIYVTDSTSISITAEQPDNDPVIRIDKDGSVHPLRAGKAVIVGNIDGVTDRINVTVYTNETAPPLYRRVPPQNK